MHNTEGRIQITERIIQNAEFRMHNTGCTIQHPEYRMHNTEYSVFCICVLYSVTVFYVLDAKTIYFSPTAFRSYGTSVLRYFGPTATSDLTTVLGVFAYLHQYWYKYLV